MCVDSHQHFWKLERGDYAWMSSDCKPIFRDFMPVDLKPLIGSENIRKASIVQAADTEFTLVIVNKTDFVAGIVGWMDFEKKSIKDDIDRLAEDPYLKGFRPMIHDIVDENWMLNSNLNHGLSYLIAKGLSFDALVRPNHLKNLIVFAKRYCDLPVVIDYIAKPRIIAGEIDQWKSDMLELSRLENVYCKYSGIVIEIGDNYSEEKIIPYVNFTFETFESKRLMWGSDWPVVTMAENYSGWVQLAMKYCANLSDNEKLDIFSNTAKAFYRM